MKAVNNSGASDIKTSPTANSTEGGFMDREPVKGSTITRFIDGAVSGLLSGVVLQPFQVIKTSMQVSPIDKPSDHHH
jgi:hypothetical protein